jgi:hypothetical protein
MAILKKTYNPIANPADEAPDCTGTVVMIDMKRCDVMMWLRSLSTHRTNTALVIEHCIVFIKANPVSFSKRTILLSFTSLRQPFLVSDGIALSTGLCPPLVCRSGHQQHASL